MASCEDSPARDLGRDRQTPRCPTVGASRASQGFLSRRRLCEPPETGEEGDGDVPRMPRLPFASRLAHPGPGRPGLLAALTGVQDLAGDTQPLKGSPRELLEQIAFDIEDISKAMPRITSTPEERSRTRCPCWNHPGTTCAEDGMPRRGYSF
ncbi:unnamed protein product [Effrenium voratum]|nr:unnamed protein product [Effrenium voratum]